MSLVIDSKLGPGGGKKNDFYYLIKMDPRLENALEQLDGLLEQEAVTDQQYKLIIEGLMIGHDSTKQSAQSQAQIQADYVSSLHRQYLNSPIHPGYQHYNADILGGYAPPTARPTVNTFNLNIKCTNNIHAKINFFVDINERTSVYPEHVSCAIQHSRQYTHGSPQELYRLYSHGTWGVWLGSRNHIRRQVWDVLGLTDSQILAIYNIVESDGAPSTINESKYILMPKRRVQLKTKPTATSVVR